MSRSNRTKSIVRFRESGRQFAGLHQLRESERGTFRGGFVTRCNSKENKKIRYAVVGLGYISQTAVLPAFAHAAENSQLAALVSGDPTKLRALSRKYQVKHTFSYEQ